VIFSSNIIKTPKSSRDGAKRKKVSKKETKERKKKRKQERKRIRKAPRVSSNKGKVNILIGEKHFNIKNPF
jgi:hypothetical protein